ncbi:hypothetical protein Pelo_18940 [Pelomyxa schiedti]|nr:hypothetical protein Pelo_18940 [Pelomyxa schiedti]
MSASAPAPAGGRKISVRIGGKDNKGAATEWSQQTEWTEKDFNILGWELVFEVDEYNTVNGTYSTDDPSAPTKTMTGVYSRRTGELDTTATFSAPSVEWRYAYHYTGTLRQGQMCVLDTNDSNGNSGQARGIVVMEEKD